MPGFYIANGKFFAEDQPSIFPDDRSFRYGDGLFETLRLAHGRIPLWSWHAKRLFSGLELLQIQRPALFTADHLLNQVLNLCKKNALPHARIRITVSRGEGGILEPSSSLFYVIQTWPLQEGTPLFNANGLQLICFPEGRKQIDMFSNLKSTNYLTYAMAARYAKAAKANDAIVLNHHGRIADLSIANIFWVMDTSVFTTPLSDGPVNGVMRSYLMDHMPVTEQAITLEELSEADEVFITNAVRGIQWVAGTDLAQFRDHRTAASVYHSLIAPIFTA